MNDDDGSGYRLDYGDGSPVTLCSGAPSNRLVRMVMLIDDSDDVKIVVGSQPTAGAAPATAASAARVSGGV
ncbi:hypothetical protein HanRHA438_Chr06g0277441 [Helianthus annuus]|nr:hypothetical protein HanIR_Chr06g0288481 [Helianthus annuus]KAJ0912714.1 hypothetical protein HanRHA438_Chr06g0277441 [Helianthus annuus]